MSVPLPFFLRPASSRLIALLSPTLQNQTALEKVYKLKLSQEGYVNKVRGKQARATLPPRRQVY